MEECVVKKGDFCDSDGNFGCCDKMRGLKCVKERPGQLGKCIKTGWDVVKVGDNKIFTYGTQAIYASDAPHLRAVLNQDYKYDIKHVYKINNIVVIKKDGSEDDLKTGKIKRILSNKRYIVDLYKASNVQSTIFAHHEIAPINQVFGYLQKHLTDNSKYMENWENVITNALRVNPGELVPTHDKWMLSPGESPYSGGRRKRKTRRLKKKVKKAKKTNRKIKKKKRRSRTRTRKRSKGSKRSKGNKRRNGRKKR